MKISLVNQCLFALPSCKGCPHRVSSQLHWHVTGSFFFFFFFNTNFLPALSSKWNLSLWHPGIFYTAHNFTVFSRLDFNTHSELYTYVHQKCLWTPSPRRVAMRVCCFGFAKTTQIYQQNITNKTQRYLKSFFWDSLVYSLKNRLENH